jgi:hypothetical protein
VLPQLMSDPSSVAAPEGMSPAPFEKMRLAATREKAVREAESASTIQKLFGQAEMKELEKKLDLKYGPKQKAAEKLAELGVLGADNPELPANKAKMKLAESVDSLRKEFNALQPVTDFSVVQNSAEALAGALKDTGKVSDQELTRYAILMIEPGLAVREGEAAAVKASQSIPDEWKGSLAGALEGKTGLGTEARAGIQRLAERAYNAKKGSYEKALNYYDGLGAGRGLLGEGESLSFLGPAPDVSSVFGAASPASGEVPPGMKLQRSRVTGETRLVPK